MLGNFERHCKVEAIADLHALLEIGDADVERSVFQTLRSDPRTLETDATITAEPPGGREPSADTASDIEDRARCQMAKSCGQALGEAWPRANRSGTGRGGDVTGSRNS